MYAHKFKEGRQLLQTRASTRKKGKRRGLKGLAVAVTILALLWIVVYFLPPGERPDHPFFQNDEFLVIAHQGGEHLAPSNTLYSYEMAADMGVDVIEFDVHMTKDGHLVTIHDDSVDRTTDGEGLVNEMTLEEIQELDAADYFQDLEGDYSYRGQGIMIPTVEEVFETVPDMDWNIELKATNDPALYREMSERMWEVIEDYGLTERVLLASFDQDIIDMVLDVSDGEALVSGGRQEVTRFVLSQKFFLNGLYRPNVDAIQIPTEESIFNLKDERLIDAAHRRNMEVYYWTINDEETMKELIDLGADGIVTDRPDLLLDILGR